MNLPLKNTQLTEREKVLSYLLDCYIVDVGIIKSIESDKKFVEVTHANKPQLYDEKTSSYKEQEATVTKHVEILYFGGSNYRIEHELSEGDVGLLLGTVAYVEKIRDLTEAKKSEFISNYSQENLKFVPVGNNEDPTTLIKVLSDEIDITTSIKNTNINLKDKLVISTDADLEVTANSNIVKANSEGLNLECVNGNTFEMKSGQVSVNGTNLEVLQ